MNTGPSVSLRGLSLVGRPVLPGSRAHTKRSVVVKAVPALGGGSGDGGFSGRGGGGGGSGDGDRRKKKIGAAALAISVLSTASEARAAKKSPPPPPPFDATAFVQHFGSAFGLSGVIGYASAKLGEPSIIFISTQLKLLYR